MTEYLIPILRGLMVLCFVAGAVFTARRNYRAMRIALNGLLFFTLTRVAAHAYLGQLSNLELGVIAAVGAIAVMGALGIGVFRPPSFECVTEPESAAPPPQAPEE